MVVTNEAWVWYFVCWTAIAVFLSVAAVIAMREMRKNRTERNLHVLRLAVQDAAWASIKRAGIPDYTLDAEVRKSLKWEWERHHGWPGVTR